MSVERRRQMVQADHASLSIVRQCALLSISRSGFYYEPAGEDAATLALMRAIDETYLKFPFYGSRQMARHLARQGQQVGRRRVRRLMARMGLRAIYQKPRTSTPNPEHLVYPYLLRGLVIDRPNQVWCTDITYISMRRGFMYLVAVLDWASRRVLSWRVSNSMETDFCIEALEAAMAHHGRPEIFNTDHGSQFTSPRFTGVLAAAGIQVSMDGRGRWMDNGFIERLWRSLKYECIYLHAFETGGELRAGLTYWIGHYNTARPPSKLAGRTPDDVYSAGPPRCPGLAACRSGLANFCIAEKFRWFVRRWWGPYDI
jgi:putative transposase